jgi:hypothetical protein
LGTIQDLMWIGDGEQDTEADQRRSQDDLEPPALLEHDQSQKELTQLAH